MWILFNEGILQLKPRVLTTYLHAVWIIQNVVRPCKRECLTKTKQKPDTLTKHLQKAEEAGLLFIKHNKYKVVDGFRSLPNFYAVLNPTKKIWIEDISDITDAISCKLLFQMGAKISKHYMDKYHLVEMPDLNVLGLCDDDYNITNICLTIDFYSRFNIFTKYDPRRTPQYIQVR